MQQDAELLFTTLDAKCKQADLQEITSNIVDLNKTEHKKTDLNPPPVNQMRNTDPL